MHKQIVNIDGLDIEIVRKPIKNIYFRVYPPNGEIKITAPLRLELEFIKKQLMARFDWLQAKAKSFKQSALHADEETYFYLGERQGVIIEKGQSKVVNQNNQFYFYLKDENNLLEKQAALDKFYRQELKKIIPLLIKKWEPILEVLVLEWGIKKMKTRWGSCNTVKRRIWLNLNLMQKSLECIEYVMVHEMVHLLEASHNRRFHSLMTQFLPNWKELDKKMKGHQ